MTKATIFKIHSGFNNVRNTFELEPHFANEENGDFAKEYELPSGYTIGENIVGRPMIFDVKGNGCEIVEHISGNPKLVSGFGMDKVLSPLS